MCLYFEYLHEDFVWLLPDDEQIAMTIIEPPQAPKEVDVTRAIKAAEKSGKEVVRAEIEKNGKIVLVFNRGSEGPASTERNEWDEVIRRAD